MSPETNLEAYKANFDHKYETHGAPEQVVHVVEIIDTGLSGSLVFSIRFV